MPRNKYLLRTFSPYYCTTKYRYVGNALLSFVNLYAQVMSVTSDKITSKHITETNLLTVSNNVYLVFYAKEIDMGIQLFGH